MFKTARSIAYSALALQLLALALHAQPDLPGATVTIPYSELKTLWEAANQKPSTEPAPPKPPVASLLRSATLTISPSVSHTTISANFEASNLSTEWQLIPLLGGEVQIDSITPAEATVVHRDGCFHILLPPSANSDLQLELSAPKLTSKGFRLDPAPAVTGKVIIAAIESADRVTAEGAVSAVADGNFTILPGGGEITIRTTAAAAPVEVAVDLPPSNWELSGESLVTFSDAVLTFTAELHLHADDGDGLSARLNFSRSARVMSVTGEDLDDWKPRRSPDGVRAIDLRWSTNQLLDRKLAVTWQIPQPPLADRWILTPPSVSPDAQSPAPFLFALLETEGLELRDAEENPLPAPQQLPGWLRSQLNGASYHTARTNADPIELRPRWLPRLETADATISSATYEQSLVPGGALLTKAKLTIDHRRATKWTVSLPADGDVLTCQVAGSAARPVLRDGGALEFALPTPDPKTSTTVVEYCYAMQLEALDPVAGQLAIELPQTDLFISQLDWKLAIPARYEPTAAQGNVEILPGSDGLKFRKQLIRGDRPAIELYYRRQD